MKQRDKHGRPTSPGSLVRGDAGYTVVDDTGAWRDDRRGARLVPGELVGLMTAPAYTIEQCLRWLENGQAVGDTSACKAILHHLRAAQANASREAEIRAEAWEIGYASGRSDGWRIAEFVRTDRSEPSPERAANPYRSGT